MHCEIQIYKFINAHNPSIRLAFDAPSTRSYNDAFPERRAILAVFEVNLAISQSKQMTDLNARNPKQTGLALAGGNTAILWFERTFGWGDRDRTYEWRIQNPLPYRLATPQ